VVSDAALPALEKAVAKWRQGVLLCSLDNPS
jgi:hypothetical protein